MLLCRTIFFKLRESPSWLVQAGRPEEALVVLQEINDINGSAINLDLASIQQGQKPKRSLSPNEGEYGPQREGREPLLSPQMAAVEDDDGFLPPLRLDCKSSGWIAYLPEPLAASVMAYIEKIRGLFEPDWRLTTLLVWAIWTLVSTIRTRLEPCNLFQLLYVR